MTFQVIDRIKELSTTTGTGTVTLNGAVSAFQAFNTNMSVGDTFYYAIVSRTANEFEVGIGTLVLVSGSMYGVARTTVLKSSNSNNLVDFTAGTKEVSLVYTAAQFAAVTSLNNVLTSVIQVVSAAALNRAPDDASYFVLNANVSLSDARNLLFSSEFIATDGGAGANYTVSLADEYVLLSATNTITGANTFTSVTTFSTSVGISAQLSATTGTFVSVTTGNLIVNSSAIPANGVYLPNSNEVGIAAASGLVAKFGLIPAITVSGTSSMVIGDAASADVYVSAFGGTNSNNFGTLFVPRVGDSTRCHVGLYAGPNSTNPPRLRMFKGRGGTSHGIVSNGDSLGALQWYSSDGVGFVYAAEIAAIVDGTPGVNDMPTRLVFLTTPDGASSATEKMRIDSLGNKVLTSQSALNTAATDGFVYIPTCAGTPTGVPTAYTGSVAIIYDTTNNKLAIYNGAWKQTAALT